MPHERRKGLAFGTAICAALLRGDSRPSAPRRWAGFWACQLFPGHMRCPEFESLLYAYFEGELLDREVAVMEAHMAICPACHTHLQGYDRAVKLAKIVLGPGRVGMAPTQVRALIGRPQSVETRRDGSLGG